MTFEMAGILLIAAGVLAIHLLIYIEVNILLFNNVSGFKYISSTGD